jgi:hypothetical protein
VIAVEMVEWALAGQHAGFEAAKIAREGRAALDAPGGGQPKPCPRCEGSKVEPGTEQEGDWVPGAMAHLPYTDEPCTACQGTGKAPASASPPAPFNPHWPPLRGE